MFSDQVGEIRNDLKEFCDGFIGYVTWVVDGCKLKKLKKVRKVIKACKKIVKATTKI